MIIDCFFFSFADIATPHALRHARHFRFFFITPYATTSFFIDDISLYFAITLILHMIMPPAFIFFIRHYAIPYYAITLIITRVIFHADYCRRHDSIDTRRSLLHYADDYYADAAAAFAFDAFFSRFIDISILLPFSPLDTLIAAFSATTCC